MKLALSSRPWELPDRYSINQMQHLEITRELGYDGIELRYPLLPDSAAGIRELAAALADLALTVVFGPCAGVPTDAAGWDDAKRVIETLHALGAKWLKCLPIDAEQVDGMVQLADLVQASGMKLCTQLHAYTLTDTIDNTERFLKEVDHPAIGVMFDPAHLQLAGDDDVAGGISRLSPWLELVNIQCLAPDPDGDDWVPVLPGAPGATDLNGTLKALPAGDWWLTVMPACTPEQDPMAVARSYRAALTDACGNNAT
jgi:sugar phosphate isomerase/epimerase